MKIKINSKTYSITEILGNGLYCKIKSAETGCFYNVVKFYDPRDGNDQKLHSQLFSYSVSDELEFNAIKKVYTKGTNHELDSQSLSELIISDLRIMGKPFLKVRVTDSEIWDITISPVYSDYLTINFSDGYLNIREDVRCTFANVTTQMEIDSRRMDFKLKI